MSDHQEIDRLQKRMIVLRNVAVASLIAFLVVSMGILVTNAIIGAQTRSVLVDCTTPEGQCFKEGQARTGDVVGKLIKQNELTESQTRRVILLAVVCQDEPAVKLEPVKAERYKMVERCVNERLKE